jgi:ADP-ribosylglycohydrolase
VEPLGIDKASLVSAVQLGGDTDTVAALVGGLLGCRLTAEQVRAELPWHRFVVVPELGSTITEMAAALATTRAVQSELMLLGTVPLRAICYEI